MNELEAMIHINSIEKIGAVKFSNLLKKFGSAKKIVTASMSDFMQVEGMNNSIAESVLNFSSASIEKELALIKKEKLKIIDFNNKDYPNNLRNIYSPPILFYVKGDLLKRDENAIAIVGSRRATYYGLSTAERLAYKLASLGVTIVSGMARGIDTAAHKGALKAKGRTIAVLGSGFKHIYPPENKEISEKIAKKGAVISEFPMDISPLRQNFPKRNRIISGLSKGVVVVEAAKRSGALITADFALEQGREVFAVPGKIESANSAGVHNLIKQGAKLVDDIEDIVEELNLDFSNVIKKQMVDSKQINIQEKEIISLLENGPMYIDNLSKKSKVKVDKLLEILIKLQIKGIIKELPGKEFIKSYNTK